MSDPVVLAPASVEAVARRVAELLRDGPKGKSGLITTAEVARLLGVSRGYVYDHLSELGAIKVGGQWRFVPPDIDAFEDAPRSAPPNKSRGRRRLPKKKDAVAASGVPLLPIHDRQEGRRG